MIIFKIINFIIKNIISHGKKIKWAGLTHKAHEKGPTAINLSKLTFFFFFFVYEAIFYVGGGHGVEPVPSAASSSLPSLFSRLCKNPRPPISPKVSFFSIFMAPFFVLCVWLSLAPAAHSLIVVMRQRAFVPLRVAWKVRIVVSKIEVFLVNQ